LGRTHSSSGGANIPNGKKQTRGGGAPGGFESDDFESFVAAKWSGDLGLEGGGNAEKKKGVRKGERDRSTYGVYANHPVNEGSRG